MRTLARVDVSRHIPAYPSKKRGNLTSFRYVIVVGKYYRLFLNEEIFNVSSKYQCLFYIIKCRLEQNERKFVIGPKGSGTCSEGSAIMDEKTCREACRSLNIPQEEILGNYKCFKDEFGDCYQNGRQHSGASMICKASEQKAGKF